MDRWRAALENLALWMPQMRIEARDSCSLGQVIELLATSEISISYIFVSATSALLSTVSTYDHPSFRGAPWLDFCAREVIFQLFLWHFINILQFATPQKDDTLRAFLRAMHAQLRQDWLYIFGDAENLQLNEILRGLDVHTPVSKIHPGTEIPEMTPNYWTNVLSLRKWRTQIKFNEDVYVDPGLREDLLESEAQTGHRFRISPIYYDHITAVDGMEDFINYAQPGILMAMKIWKAVLNNPKLSNSSRQFYKRHVSCLKDTLGLTDEKRITVFLGVRSALNMGRVPDWHLANIRSRRFGDISRSKLFYLWYYRQGACHDLVDGYITSDEAHAVARILRHTSDFSQAFDCKLVKHGETCLVD
ncbi:unnamed protein product [Ixodes hexagonus]